MSLVTKEIPLHANHAEVSSIPVTGAYFLIALGEMLLAPIGLSMISHLAPRKLTALLIGFWYVCVGFAFYIGGILASMMETIGTLSNFFLIFVAITAVPALVLLFIRDKVLKLTFRS